MKRAAIFQAFLLPSLNWRPIILSYINPSVSLQQMVKTENFQNTNEEIILHFTIHSLNSAWLKKIPLPLPRSSYKVKTRENTTFELQIRSHFPRGWLLDSSMLASLCQLGRRQTWVQVSVMLVLSCVAFGSLFDLVGPYFLNWNSRQLMACLRELLREWKKNG